MRRRAATIVGADGSEWHETGISPDQLFGWLNAAAAGLYEQNEKIEVDLDKWAAGAPRRARGALAGPFVRTLRLRPRRHAPSASASRDRRRSRGAAAAPRTAADDDGAAANATHTDGRLGTRCNAAELPACCRFKAWSRGVAAKDYERVEGVHDFGHMRIASPLFIKLNKRSRVPCAHHADESDPLSKVRARAREPGGGARAWRQPARRATAASGGRSTSAA